MNERYLIWNKIKKEIENVSIINYYSNGDVSVIPENPLVKKPLLNSINKKVSEFELLKVLNKRDINNNLIYHKSICIDPYKRLLLVYYSEHFFRWQVVELTTQKKHVTKSPVFDWLYPDIQLKVVGNIFKKKAITNKNLLWSK